MNDYEVHVIPHAIIYNDIDFNCRGRIMPMDVIDLAKDIEENGLQTPISIQPAADVAEGIPAGFEYRIIAGHRRFEAFRLLKMKEIPAMIKTGFNEQRARLTNLSENLKRQELNMTQEAEAISKLVVTGMTQQEIATALGMSRSWVQVRVNLLRLPDEIQEEAAAGMLNQHQIMQLTQLKSPEQQFNAVKKIKEARDRGDQKVTVDVGKSPLEDPYKSKKRNSGAVQEMMDYLGREIGFGLHTRVLAWVNGAIDSATLYQDITDFAIENGIEYTNPLLEKTPCDSQ